MKKRPFDMKIGDKQGELEIVSEPYSMVYKSKHGNESTRRMIDIKCSCGIEKTMRLESFIISKSCGHIDKNRFTILLNSEDNPNKIHGFSGHPLHTSWNKLRFRKGAKVIKEWEDFTVFYDWAINTAGWKEGLVIYRKDLNGIFCPENCAFDKHEIINGLEYQNKKKKKIFFDKYGVDHPCKSPEVKQKILNTTLAKYGKMFPQSNLNEL